jgi:hypothetical protein
MRKLRKPFRSWFLFLAVFLFAFFPGNGFSRDLVDKSEAVLFPAKLGEDLKTFKSFRTFWWNFLVLDYTDQREAIKEASDVCSRLKAEPNLDRVECQQNVQAYQGILSDWIRDLPLRHSLPALGNVRARFNATLARLSLPLPPEVFSLLREDPFESYKELQETLSKRLRLKLERREGFFMDEEQRRIVIPLQPSFGPADREKTESFLKAAVGNSSGQWGLIGPHGSSAENRSQIEKDLGTVSLVGILCVLFFAALLLKMRQTRLLLLLPPVAIGAVLSAATVILIFGSIHGLALSFGGGIIGLTVDYGLHVAYHGNSKSIWRSNGVGFLTTMVCLIVLMFSSVPLMKELMIFSALGFAYSYIILYFFQQKFPTLIVARPMKIRMGGTRIGAAAAFFCLLGAFVGVFVVELKLDPRQFDFQTKHTKQLTEWLGKKMGNVSPLFSVTKSSEYPLKEAHAEKSWAEERGIAIENIAQYLPPVPIQTKNLESWTSVQCGDNHFSKDLTPVERRLFGTFLQRMECGSLKALEVKTSAPSYVSHLFNEGNWLSLWLPKDADQTASIKERFPGAQSLLEIVLVFPRTLSQELKWMAPLSLALVWCLLLLHFKSPRVASIGMIPFLTGTGLTAWGNIILGLPMSFISLIGLVMILGLSVDYAVFAVDHYRNETTDESDEKTGTALFMAWITTLLGFLPLAFCKHPVLQHLGQTLTLGTIGTMAGAFWAVPYLMGKKK